MPDVSDIPSPPPRRRPRALAPRRAASSLFRGLLAIEFTAIFLAGPAFVAYGPLRFPIIPTLVVFGAACFAMLMVDASFDRRSLWNAAAARAALPAILTRFLLAAVVIGAGAAIFEPDSLFGFLRRAPLWWLAVMVLYPVFSVYPQEVIYRAFLSHRYEPVFGAGWAMVGAGAVAFGWAHIVLHNWLAIVMTAIGGALFARTYLRSRSILACSIEHALYGDFLFTIGLGAYFYAGSNR